MEKKGRKNNKYTYEFKAKVIEEYLKGGLGYTKLAKKFDVNPETVKGWIAKYKKGGFEELKKDNRGKSATGRPKKVKTKEYESMSDKEKIEYLEMENDILKKLKEIRKDNQR